MPQLCTKCSRANPPEAVYCFFDGFVLGGHERRGGPISVGSQPFNSPFVFPTGRTCRNFDELALACQEEWSVACDLLRDGYLESFFGGLGRVDLARAAKESARFPDVERGLDQLLEKIPSTVLAEPKLRVDPVEVSLGVLDSGKERTFSLELENTGGRLLYGTASSSDSAWISLGEAGATEKHFQFTDELKITVHLRPGNLRASSKPIEAKILLESNGGTIPVILKAEKPVKLFPTGPLKGAKTPRQVAEMAMKAAKEVGPLFESGDVERWYEGNGWIYPVKTPAASGLAAIQQFFEALGVTKPPKVEISRRDFFLTADPGDTIPLEVEVSTPEKKAVWAHAVSNVPWLEVSKPKCNGRTATVSMSVPSVPDRPGETLEGELTVIGNGNVRWQVPVRIEVGGELAAAEMVGESAFDFSAPAPRPKSAPEVTLRPKSTPAIQEEAPRPPPPPPTKRRNKEPGPSLLHLIPAAVLLLAVLGVIGFDLLVGKNREVPPEITENGGGSDLLNYNVANLRDKRSRLGVSFTNEARFGVVLRNSNDPDNPALWKKLTASPNGDTNNTIVKIGEIDGYKFGDDLGGRAFFMTPGGGRARTREERVAELPAPRVGWVSRMRYRTEQVLVTQHVEVVPGKTSYLDTCLVYYSIRNDNTIPQKVGLRVMLDTFIGDNDGVPFTIPGERGFVDKQRTLEADQIPDYVEVVENPDDPKDPGTIVRLGLKGLRLPGVELTEPGRLVICRFQGSNVLWDFAREDMKEKGARQGDSCVAIYWPETILEPKKTRYLAFTYGMSNLDLGDRLTLSVPTSVVPNREFIVTCYVYSATKGQKVRLNLPDGLSFSGSEKAEKVIDEDSPRTQVFWKVRAAKDGTFPITAASGPATSRETKVLVKALGLFG